MGSDFAERYIKPSANATLILQQHPDIALQWALQGLAEGRPSGDCQCFFAFTRSVASAGEPSVEPPLPARTLKT